VDKDEKDVYVVWIVVGVGEWSWAYVEIRSE